MGLPKNTNARDDMTINIDEFSEMSEWLGQRYEDMLKQSPWPTGRYRSESSPTASPGKSSETLASFRNNITITPGRAREIASTCHHNVAQARGPKIRPN
jgi:hypothetical protein